MYVDLSDNKIQGEILNWIWEVGNGRLSYLYLSHNNLTSLQDPYTFPSFDVLDLHSNRLSGAILIPASASYIDFSDNLFNSSLLDTICNAVSLKVLDLSNNRLTRRIPQCLIESGNDLGVLNLANNGLTGQIEGTFPTNCSLNTLDLHGNSLVGEIPRSLINCTTLEVLNLGNNKINDTYPCFLGSNSNLHVLVLRSNNDFNGVLPPEFFSQWGAMMTAENGNTSKKQLRFTVPEFYDLYYQDSVTVTAKGFELELVKILTIFTTIDISRKIPTGSQFQTFSETSYLGNKRLCGFPLNRSCASSVVPVSSSSPNSDTSSDGNDWQTVILRNGSWSRIINCCSARKGESLTKIVYGLIKVSRDQLTISDSLGTCVHSEEAGMFDNRAINNHLDGKKDNWIKTDADCKFRAGVLEAALDGSH
ncbi:receptor-like protein 12 [Tanacetum coccineum]